MKKAWGQPGTLHLNLRSPPWVSLWRFRWSLREKDLPQPGWGQTKSFTLLWLRECLFSLPTFLKLLPQPGKGQTCARTSPASSPSSPSSRRFALPLAMAIRGRSDGKRGWGEGPRQGLD